MSDELEPLGPLAQGFLAAERRRGDVGRDVEDRLLARVAASVAIGAAVVTAASVASASSGGAGAGALGGGAA
ncbi:MAG: hypothetical protein JWP97_2512, partial [Labilithrix sp.]|nr:hypothetical protein [Labilithrix sp.]